MTNVGTFSRVCIKYRLQTLKYNIKEITLLTLGYKQACSLLSKNYHIIFT